MSENNMIPENCTHDCSTCSAACAVDENGQPVKSIFQRMEDFADVMSEVGEEKILEMLNEQIAEWEAEEKAEGK